MTNDKFDPTAFFVAYGLAMFVIWLLLFGLCGGVAAIVAPEGRRYEFFWITLIFLGPLGIGFAAIAPTRAPKLSDAWRYRCESCGAIQNVPHGTTNADCYRCDENLF